MLCFRWLRDFKYALHKSYMTEIFLIFVTFQLDSHVIEGIALGDPSVKNKRILKVNCVRKVSMLTSARRESDENQDHSAFFRVFDMQPQAQPIDKGEPIFSVL